MSRKFAVIDTETNWNNKVMSIGVLVAKCRNFEKTDSRYYILPQEEKVGGMYSKSMRQTTHEIITGQRTEVISDVRALLNSNGVDDLFAYNASFDKNHLPELSDFCWHDIMKIAAYKQHNPCIPDHLPCCKTGRLKRGYGVEPMLQMLGVEDYCETHNAVIDARDELKIMIKLGYEIDYYPEI
ncbi:hypothetical protein [Methanobrevibacter sp.]|uniref:hypothetical protein n=1 Tax=Methanobrevibacter sp. TaxID=66852 RepID=UPI00386B8C12